jgi:peptidoglycan/xylan/chitin deacetylase (PgdA/CDA1 family)
MAQVDEEHGVCSAWYFVPERYPIDLCRFEELRARGHEIGLHGLKHSGKLFSSRAEFESRLPRINHYVRSWRVRGFRSPATFRNAYWLTEIDVDYDSSYMDNARFEPQPGGVCAPFPFMLSQRLVELPITLPMDHTLINVLRQDVVPVCEQKVAWIRQQYGLALSLFHPEYNSGSRALSGGLTETEIRFASSRHEAERLQRLLLPACVDFVRHVRRKCPVFKPERSPRRRPYRALLYAPGPQVASRPSC